MLAALCMCVYKKRMGIKEGRLKTPASWGIFDAIYAFDFEEGRWEIGNENENERVDALPASLPPLMLCF